MSIRNLLLLAFLSFAVLSFSQMNWLLNNQQEADTLQEVVETSIGISDNSLALLMLGSEYAEQPSIQGLAQWRRLSAGLEQQVNSLRPLHSTSDEIIFHLEYNLQQIIELMETFTREQTLPQTGYEQQAHFNRNILLTADRIANWSQLLLQQSIENNRIATSNRRQHMMFYAVISLIWALFFFTLIYWHVSKPVRDLTRALSGLGRNDFEPEVHRPKLKEFRQIANAFENSRNNLNVSRTLLIEQSDKLANKANALQISNTRLSLLLEAAQKLQGDDLSAEQISRWFQRLELHLGHRPVYICLKRSNEPSFRLHSNPPKHGTFQRCNAGDCSTCPVNAVTQACSRFEILFEQQLLGFLYVLGNEQTLCEEDRSMLDGVCDLLGTHLHSRQLTDKKRELALAEERSSLARELHDSLAQALTYLKFQVSRMRRQLARQELEEQDLGQLQSINEELRTGLNDAYKQLRELISTFRISASGDNLSGMLHVILETSRLQFPQVTINLDNKLPNDVELDKQQLKHVIDVIREALSNALKHANAERIELGLILHDGQLLISIQDNGQGLPTAHKGGAHYGLQIMQERADILGGELVLESAPGKGTLVRLSLPCADLAKAS